MAKPEIIGSARSTYTRVVRMVCEEKGIDYTLKETTLGSPELRAIHPFGKMPVLRHGHVELFESKAIATYLDRSFAGPVVFPSDPRLAAIVDRVPLHSVLSRLLPGAVDDARACCNGTTLDRYRRGFMPT